MSAETWPIAWRGRWIWAGDPPAAPIFAFSGVPEESTWNRFCYLRRSFYLDSVPASVPARMTADSRYVVYINGAEVSRGPARNVPERLAYQEVDLAPNLRAGRNAVAALVRYYGRPAPWWRPAAPSQQLGFGSFVFEAPEVRIVSDGSWKGRPAPYRQDAPIPHWAGGVPTEVLDGREVPFGWTDADFDDSEWAPVSELRGGFAGTATMSPPNLPYSALESSEISQLSSISVQLTSVAEGFVARSEAGDPLGAYPEETASGDDPFVTYDARGVTLATPWVVVVGPPGAVVDLYGGEDRRQSGLAEVRPANYALRYTLAGTGHLERVEGFEATGFRYLTVVTRGAEIIGAGAVERRYPRSDHAYFACDDPRLEAVWNAGARSLDLCSTDAFIDCPGREQRAWLGDAYIHALVSHVAATDWRLVRRHLRIAAHSRRGDGLLAMAAASDLSMVSTTIPDYSLHWIRQLARYHEYSGDLETVLELLATASDVVAFFEKYRGNDGLLHDVPGWVFIDWAQIERAEVTGALDALYVAALDDLASLLETVGDVTRARRARSLADRTRQGFEDLWDERRGAYVDAKRGEERGRRVSQQTNALAIVSGCAPGERWDRILDFVLDEGRLVRTATPADSTDRRAFSGAASQWGDPAEFTDFDPEKDVVLAQPFFSHFVHQAAVMAGRRNLIADLCLRWYPQIDQGYTTFGEYWEAPPGRASRCHAWSATPTFDLTTHVLGVRPAEPGYERAAIRPFFGRLARLGGRVPTPYGMIELELTRRGGRLSIPLGVTARVDFEDSDIRGGELGPGSHLLEPAGSRADD